MDQPHRTLFFFLKPQFSKPFRQELWRLYVFCLIALILIFYLPKIHGFIIFAQTTSNLNTEEQENLTFFWADQLGA